MKELYQIHTSYGTYGIVVEDDHVVQSAPIAQWMTGLPLGRIIEWVRGKKGTIQLVGRSRSSERRNDK